MSPIGPLPPPQSFFFHAAATTQIYTLSLHDALPILDLGGVGRRAQCGVDEQVHAAAFQDRKSTRLNSSHMSISYAVFCLKKKRKDAGDLSRALPRQPHRAHTRSPPPPVGSSTALTTC